MKLLRNFMATLVVLASIVVGFVIAVKNPPEFLSMPAEITAFVDDKIGLLGGANGVFFSAIGFSLAGIFTVMASFMGAPKQRDIRVDLDGGSVVMSEGAIRSYLETAMTEFPQIGVKKIGIYSTSRGLLVQMQAELRTQQHVPDLEQSIITRIHVALVKELGISKVKQVMVSVAGFRPGAGHPAHGAVVSKTVAKPPEPVAAAADNAGAGGASVDIDPAPKA